MWEAWCRTVSTRVFLGTQTNKATNSNKRTRSQPISDCHLLRFYKVLLDWTCFNSNRIILNNTPLLSCNEVEQIPFPPPSARISSTTRCPENQRRGCSKDCRVRNLLGSPEKRQIHQGRNTCIHLPLGLKITLQGTNIFHQWERKLIIPTAFGWDMLVPRRVLHSRWNVGEHAVGGLSGIVLPLQGSWNCFQFPHSSFTNTVL